MFAKQISVQKNEANWDELLNLVHNGTEIIIMQGEQTIAKIVAAENPTIEPIQERILGAHPGAWMSDDFDSPFSDEFWLGKDA